MKKIRHVLGNFITLLFMRNSITKRLKVHENQEGFIVDSITNTLTKAYSIIEEGGQPLAPETICIQCMFLSPAHISAFHNDDSTLNIFAILVRERFNVSFPEEKAYFDQYFADCIQLKEQLELHKTSIRIPGLLIHPLFLKH